ncbi:MULTISPECIES: ThiF family adenylyltransferase [Novilysobacter]|uniref:ThiF family adenylyltransferase n=1 Tax=Novilysobacter TaxID=3382699 RepID=UPI002EDA628E
MRVILTLTGQHHAQLQQHLFPGDGEEAAAILLCGRLKSAHTHRLLVREVHAIPYSECSVRTPVQLTWRTDCIVPLLDRAEREGWTLVKVHSHPTGIPEFSETDTAGDLRLLPAIRDWVEASDRLHASVVMLPSGAMFGRYLDRHGTLVALDAIQCVGDDLRRWAIGATLGESAASHVAAFGEETFRLLGDMSIAVVGCSGTGAPLIEQIARLAPRELVLVDDDVVEVRNLNRIPNATREDAEARRRKVDVLADAVRRMDLGTTVRVVPRNLWSAEAVHAVAECDLVFGCMDSIDGRFLLNLLATDYVLPYIDVGVRLVANEKNGNIQAACGSIHYLQPGGSSLISRGLFTMEDVRAAGLRRSDPDAHAQQVKDGYIRGAPTSRPAVVSINFQLAAMAVTELLARLHPFRDSPNRTYEHLQLDLADMTILHEQHSTVCPIIKGRGGLGDRTPLLGLPELSDHAKYG